MRASPAELGHLYDLKQRMMSKAATGFFSHANVAATYLATLIIVAGTLLFNVPIVGNLGLLAMLTTLFIAANLSIGYTLSTLAKNQLQAIQMAMMFFLPNMLLSGFLFPFAGMPVWAQWIGEALPLTHYLRIVRAIMLKGVTLSELHFDTLALVGLMLIAMTIAIGRFRRTLD